MRRRSSSRPSASVRLFSCGKRPSSRPVTNTVWNSRPFAECTVMSCSAGRPSASCVSPASSAACARNAVNGSVAPSSAPLSGAGASGSTRSDSIGASRRELRFAHEAVGRGDELVEVLDAVLPILLGAVMRHEARLVDDVLDGLRQRQRARIASQLLDQPAEAASASPALPVTLPARRDLPQARALALRDVLQLLERARADAARREDSRRAGTRRRPRARRSGAGRRARA